MPSYVTKVQFSAINDIAAQDIIDSIISLVSEGRDDIDFGFVTAPGEIPEAEYEQDSVWEAQVNRAMHSYRNENPLPEGMPEL